MSNRMERLAGRAEGRGRRDLPDPGERLVYEPSQRRLVLYGRDGSVRGLSVYFDIDPTMPLTTKIERVGEVAVIHAWPGGVQVA